MGYLNRFCMLALFLAAGVYTQQCSDCVNFKQCPAALELALNKRNADTVKKFKNASCGYDYSGTQQEFKVCCSSFSIPASTSEDDHIDNHPNLILLPENCGEIRGDRLLGGTIAELYQFPWMVLIAHNTRDGYKFKCGGSIINKRWVLTAAHCVKDKIVVGVRVGEFDISKQNDCRFGVCETHIQDLPIDRSVIHENYSELPKLTNDIALLRLKADIDFNYRNAAPICLPVTNEQRQVPLSGKHATLCYWGLTESGEPASILRKVVIPIHSAEQCSEIYNRLGVSNTTTNQFCAGATNRDSCDGDSGGPLIVEQMYNNSVRFIQYGIGSHGPRQCGSNYPGVYTDVTKYMDWILDNISP